MRKYLLFILPALAVGGMLFQGSAANKTQITPSQVKTVTYDSANPVTVRFWASQTDAGWFKVAVDPAKFGISVVNGVPTLISNVASPTTPITNMIGARQTDGSYLFALVTAARPLTVYRNGLRQTPAVNYAVSSDGKTVIPVESWDADDIVTADAF